MAARVWAVIGTRQFAANALVLCFILLTGIGAGMIAIPVGLIVAGVGCGVFGFLLGLD